MPKDYAAKSRTASRTSTPKSRSPRKTKAKATNNRFWLGFVSGVVCTGASLVAYNGLQKPTVKGANQTSTKETAPAIPKPRFDFYNILQESTVKVDAPSHSSPPPNHAISSRREHRPQESPPQQTSYTPTTPARHSVASSKPDTSKTTSAPKKQWSLQAGSFRDKTDADRLRARLLLQNFMVKVDTVHTPTKGTWHRVLIGPYSDQQSLSKTRSQLSQLGIKTFSIRS